MIRVPDNFYNNPIHRYLHRKEFAYGGPGQVQKQWIRKMSISHLKSVRSSQDLGFLNLMGDNK